ncbi:MAG: hypothetical protein COU09_01415 [Candidatus Harrisonbacteria bacterium CG10_big_fil_rev_8_21_14_0_10_44_23]|uniref:Septum formation initiator n=1 Tax=Candidatus Harrisonbacteria bacterium CG10_big_fil_rev_8_21_14_0_10_44_23 TaxID=1974585 RepID=A0A2H0UQF8_9BACT|nr:MAG: hypothetical protein COU09_01415 [Candidatus Harrisonbacteria bacterium CG10_big_fil_rev_8_21_14_0_10_44_23]
MRRNLIATTIILALIAVLAIQLNNINRERLALKSALKEDQKIVSELDLENADLTAEIQYFGIPDNLAKEFKSRFNYRRPGEKMFILVPEE